MGRRSPDRQTHHLVVRKVKFLDPAARQKRRHCHRRLPYGPYHIGPGQQNVSPAPACRPAGFGQYATFTGRNTVLPENLNILRRLNLKQKHNPGSNRSYHILDFGLKKATLT
jgi:hypothetical protein